MSCRRLMDERVAVRGIVMHNRLRYNQLYRG